MICKTREKGIQTPSTTHPCNSLIIFCDLLKIMWFFLFFFSFLNYDEGVMQDGKREVG